MRLYLSAIIKRPNISWRGIKSGWSIFEISSRHSKSIIYIFPVRYLLPPALPNVTLIMFGELHHFGLIQRYRCWHRSRFYSFLGWCRSCHISKRLTNLRKTHLFWWNWWVASVILPKSEIPCWEHSPQLNLYFGTTLLPWYNGIIHWISCFSWAWNIIAFFFDV